MATALIFSLVLCLGAVAATSKINCNDGKYYIRADPDSCSHFYKCDNGKPVRFACPSGLYYNPTTHVCDWPYNVKCNVNRQNDNDNNNGQQYNNNGQSYNDNNGNNNGQSYNNNNGNKNGQQNTNYNGNNNGQQSNSNNQNQNDDSYNYPVQSPLTLDGGPSIQSPSVSERPRPTVDDQSNGSQNYYTDSAAGNQNQNKRRS